MTITLSAALKDKARDLQSMTIPSPLGRTSAESGQVVPVVIYFDNAINKNGKPAPTSKSKIYTPNSDEASVIVNCIKDMVHTLQWQGTEYRFLDSELTAEEVAEIKQCKGLNTVLSGFKLIKKQLERITNPYSMSLPLEIRLKNAQALSELVNTYVDKMSKEVKAGGRRSKTVMPDTPPEAIKLFDDDADKPVKAKKSPKKK